MLADEAAHHIAEHRPERNPCPGRLNAKQTAARGRDADGTATVVSVSHRYDSSRNRRSRSATRAAHRVLRCPGIARWAEELRLGRRDEAEFGRVRLARDHEACPLEATGQCAVERRDKVLEELGALRLPDTRISGTEVFHQKRHAGEGPI